FTGSNEVGLRLYQRVAARGVKVTLEMGGKNPVLVMDDADLDLAVEGIVQGAFGSTGQRCTATARVVTTPSIAPKLTEALVERARKLRVGNGMQPGVHMGPAVDAGPLRTDLDASARASSEGGELLCGEAQLPFGGIKATGVGEKEMAEEGSNFFTHLKTVWLDYTGSKRNTNIY